MAMLLCAAAEAGDVAQAERTWVLHVSCVAC